MRRASAKPLMVIAAVLTLALLAFVFAGGSPADRPPSDRLTDQQAMAPPGPARQPADASAILPGTDATEQAAFPPPPPPPPEPEVEPGSLTQPTQIVSPAPPAPRRSSAQAEVRQAAASRAPAKVRADSPRPAEVRKTKPKAVASDQRRAASPAQTANASAAAPIVTTRPSYNCRYARTRSEVAVCRDAGLARLDQQMAAQFNTAYRQGTPAQREVLERSRLRFLYRRDRCQSASCMADVYRARMSEITDIAARNWREP